MKHKESAQISKSAFQLVEQTKNVTAQNLAAAVANGDLKVDRAMLPMLISLVQASIDEGFHQANRQFEAVVDEALTSACSEAKK